MRISFEQLDTKHNGVLTYKEIYEGFKNFDIYEYETEAKRVFEVADFDKNGTIEFSEWCTATMDKKRMLTTVRL